MKNTGGSAFPVLAIVSEYDEDAHKHTGAIYSQTTAGMTLRDYFAGRAMQGLMARVGAHEAHLVVHDAYIVADAMLAERAK